MSINDEMNKFFDEQMKEQMSKLSFDLGRAVQNFNAPKSRLEVVLKTFGFIEPKFATEGCNRDQGYWVNNWFDAIEVKPDGDGYDLIANFYTVHEPKFEIDVFMHHLARGLDSIMSILSDDECGIDPQYCKSPAPEDELTSEE